MKKVPIYLGTGADAPFTFACSDADVAIVATVFFGEGKFGLLDESGNQLIPRDVDLEPFLAQRGILLAEFLEKRLPELALCLASFLFGTLADRRVFDAQNLHWPNASTVRQVRWNDRKAREFGSNLWNVARRMVHEVALKQREKEGK